MESNRDKYTLVVSSRQDVMVVNLNKGGKFEQR